MDNTIVSVLVGVVGVAMFISGFNISLEIIKSEAVQTECAQYNPVSGDFEWVEVKK